MFITHSGREIYLETFSEKDVCLEDIAHHLTKICRFAGALEFCDHYSVARHCIELTKHAYVAGCSRDVLKAILLHDAAEAYLGDVQSSLKKLLPDYQLLEKKVSDIIFNKYDVKLNSDVIEVVEHLDKSILLSEAKSFFDKSFYPSFEKTSPKGAKPLPIRFSRKEYLNDTYDTFLTMCFELEIRDE